jgi:hypothetical protein
MTRLDSDADEEKREGTPFETDDDNERERVAT